MMACERQVLCNGRVLTSLCLVLLCLISMRSQPNRNGDFACGEITHTIIDKLNEHNIDATVEIVSANLLNETSFIDNEVQDVNI
jgi:hypothetical protein